MLSVLNMKTFLVVLVAVSAELVSSWSLWGADLSATDADPCDTCKCEDTTTEYHINCSHMAITSFKISDIWKPPYMMEMDNLTLPDVKHNLKPIWIDLSHNDISTVDEFPDLPIERIKLNHNSIASMEDRVFQKLHRLTILDLSYNSLDSASLTPKIFMGPFEDGEWEQLHVEMLDLSYNSLHSIHKEAFDYVSNLVELRLAGNPLQQIDHATANALVSLPQLHTLSLANTQLQSIPQGVFSVYRHLVSLDLSNNKLSEVSDQLRTTHKLTELNLNDNPIEELRAGAFTGLDKLQILSLSHMEKLWRIHEEAFSDLTSMHTFTCSYNPLLTDIHYDAFKHLPDGVLQNVDLSNNALENLSPELLSWKSLEILDLQNNPWQCDCRMKFFPAVVSHIWDNSPDLTMHLRCSGPDKMIHQSLFMLNDPEDFQCSKQQLQEMNLGSMHSRPHHYKSGAVVGIVVVGLLVALVGSLTLLAMLIKKAKVKHGFGNRIIKYERAPELNTEAEDEAKVTSSNPVHNV